MKLSNPSLHPFELVVAQLLHDNPKSTISDATLENFAYRNITVREPLEGEEPQRNTSIEIDLLGSPSDVDGDWVTFIYHRFDLAGLFEDVILNNKNNVKEWDLVVDETGIVTDGFEEVIKGIFGLHIHEDDGFYTLTKTPYQVVMSATDNNPAFQGSVTFEVIRGLKSRLGIKEMAGFTEPYSEPRIVGDIRITTPAVGQTGTVQGEVDVISDADFNLTITLDKDYPDTAENKGIHYSTQLLGVTLPPGVEPQLQPYQLSVVASEVIAKLTESNGPVNDGYTMHVEVEHEGGSVFANSKFFIGETIEDCLLITDNGVTGVSAQIAKANYEVRAKDNIDMHWTFDGGSNHTLNGAPIVEGQRMRLTAGSVYQLTSEFPRDGVIHTLNVYAISDNDPAPSADRVPHFGQVHKVRNVSLEASIEILTHNLPSSYATYYSSFSSECTVQATGPYTLKYYANGILKTTLNVTDDWENTNVVRRKNIGLTYGLNDLTIIAEGDGLTHQVVGKAQRLYAPDVSTITEPSMTFEGQSATFSATYTARENSTIVWSWRPKDGSWIELSRTNVGGSSESRPTSQSLVPTIMADEGNLVKCEVFHTDDTNIRDSASAWFTTKKKVVVGATFAFESTSTYNTSYGTTRFLFTPNKDFRGTISCSGNGSGGLPRINGTVMGWEDYQVFKAGTTYRVDILFPRDSKTYNLSVQIDAIQINTQPLVIYEGTFRTSRSVALSPPPPPQPDASFSYSQTTEPSGTGGKTYIYTATPHNSGSFKVEYLWDTGGSYNQWSGAFTNYTKGSPRQICKLRGQTGRYEEVTLRAVNKDNKYGSQQTWRYTV